MPRILLIAIFTGIALIMGMLFLWPKYQNLNNTQLELKNKETELQFREEYYHQLNSLSEHLKEFETGLANIDSALPSDSSSAVLSFYDYLQRASSENGLILTNIGSFALAPSSGRSNIQIIAVSIEVAGSYSSLKNFLKALEKSARIIEVTSISFSSPGEEKLFAFRLGIQTHSY